MNVKELEFLKESNAIERVYDADSLMQAVYAWEYLKTQKKMNVPVVLKTHKILMINQLIAGYERGYFRTVPVSVGGNLILATEGIKKAITDWCKETNKKGNGVKRLHIEFEKIHPFVDGNGRVGRMLMNWTNLRKDRVIQVIHEDKEQMEYYNWFK